MTTKDFKSDLIEIFFTHSDYAAIWEQNRNNELVHSRYDIVNSNINHFLKQKSKTPQELFDVVKQSIQVFELDQNTFDKSIEYMIKMDYIKLEDQKYIKIFY
jgi:uncharacterized tellurite resistance protein B-like protein